uniref:ubiquitinyl hydrolase 1 n=1 Tax=Fundulus heteroclitus TaxID=8078 RepID=A0A3Q2T5N5_FUNHE
MEALALRRSELETEQRQAKEKMMKFEKFVAENEVKRRRALKHCEAALEQNILKQREIEDLTEQLTKLEARRQVLKQRTEKYKIYEDYLMKTLDLLPTIYRYNSYESLVMPIIRRHQTLSITHQELLQRLRRMEAEVEQGQRQLQNLKRQHNIRKLMSTKELCELQSELESLKEKNKQAEVNLLMNQGASREKVEEVGKLLMAVNNLAQQCYISQYGPLKSMSVLTMMDMVKEFILDKADTERRARRLESCSTAALMDKRFKDQIIQSEEVLVSAGFDEASFSHHQSTVLQVVNQCMAAEQEDTLLRLFNQQLISDSVVQFLRLLTSAHLQTHADFFCNFVEAPDLKAYCRQEVELMAMECDHVDILALSQALDVGIHIVSMEGDEQQLVHHVIPEGADPAVRLLYQTSHYDILYRRTQP